ncbi:MAG: ABC transporter permease [Thermoleophilia bacterium]|nr:ABC transporter permease [Thermoleophilia bacterium]
MTTRALGDAPQTAGGAPRRPSGSGLRTAARWLRPLGRALAVAAFVVVVTFLLIRAVPGDAVTTIAGPRASPETKAELREQLHLDRTMPEQFSAYVQDLGRADLGRSLVQQGRPVTTIVGETLTITLYLVFASIVISLVVGVALGLLAATRHGWPDVTVRAGLTVLLAVPPFFLGLILILVAGLNLAWLPAGGWPGTWPDNLEYLVLPSLALAGYLIPLVARTTRQAANDALAQPWAEASETRGLSRARIMFRHVLPNSLLPVVTLVGYNAGAMIAGAVVVEAVFGIPGIGQELVTAVNARDYPVIQGIALVSALLVVAANLAADLLVAAVDPRTTRA